ncbi:MAG: hypothetical protein KDD42_01060 [Bdellovibrionales bacterium]|nr:hypothetical protein [Bdellovibrionales bacterium]
MRILLSQFLLAFCLVSTGLATELRYSVTGYGTRHVVVVLKGNIPNSLTTSMSSDGLSARVSGVNVAYLPENDRKFPALVSTIQQLRRGATTDLIINLTRPAELSATPGSSALKLYLRTKEDTSHRNKSHKAKESNNAPAQKLNSPLKVISHRTYSSERDSKERPKDYQTTIVFPESTGLQSATGLSQVLRDTAYGLDLVWALLSGMELQYAEGASPASLCSDQSGEIDELNSLVQDLTKELVEVRQELALKNAQSSEKDSR